MILIALGSNLAFAGRSPEAIIACAAGALAAVGAVVRLSRLYSSPAQPREADPPFVNAVASIETALSPLELLAALQGMEAGFGRRRRAPNAPRTLDLDLLDYQGLVLSGERLHLPHPRMRARDFVLAPLAEIAPDWLDPVTGETAGAALAKLERNRACPLV